MGAFSCADFRSASGSGRIVGIDAQKHDLSVFFSKGVNTARIAETAASHAEVLRLGRIEVFRKRTHKPGIGILSH